MQYPIFIKYRDDYISKASSIYGIEVNDVEEVAAAWDAKGRPLRIYLAGKKMKEVECELASTTPQINKFKDAIKEYAEVDDLVDGSDEAETDVEKIYDSLRAPRKVGLFQKWLGRS